MPTRRSLPTAGRRARDLEFLHRSAAVRDGRVGLHHHCRAGCVPFAAGGHVSQHCATDGGGLHRVSGRECGCDRRDSGDPARAGLERCRGHALPALGELLYRHDDHLDHVRGGDRSRNRRDQHAESGAERAAAVARGGTAPRRDRRESAARHHGSGDARCPGRPLRRPVRLQLRHLQCSRRAATHSWRRQHPDIRRA